MRLNARATGPDGVGVLVGRAPKGRERSRGLLVIGLMGFELQHELVLRRRTRVRQSRLLGIPEVVESIVGFERGGEDDAAAAAVADRRSMGGEPGDPTSCQAVSWRGTVGESIGGAGTAAWQPKLAAGRVASGFRPVGRVVGAGEGVPSGGFRPGVMATSAPWTSSDHRGGVGVVRPDTAAVRRVPASAGGAGDVLGSSGWPRR